MRMKITKMTTMPAVVSGRISGVIRATMVCSAPGSGWRTSTGIGFGATARSLAGGLAGRGPPLGLSISLPSSCNTSEARSSVPVPAAAPRRLCIFPRSVAWYCGRSLASWFTCETINAPKPEIAPKAISTTTTTAKLRGTRQVSINRTSGASTKLRSTASAIGTNTSRPK